MPSFSGRLKLSLCGALFLWMFARSVFAIEVIPTQCADGRDSHPTFAKASFLNLN